MYCSNDMILKRGSSKWICVPLWFGMPKPKSIPSHSRGAIHIYSNIFMSKVMAMTGRIHLGLEQPFILHVKILVNIGQVHYNIVRLTLRVHVQLFDLVMNSL